MLKFQLTWRMEIEDINGNIQEFGYPLTVDFSVNRNTMAGAQDAEFTVYNLSESLRNLIRKNYIAMNDYRTVKFYAGYQGNAQLIFQGQVLIAKSDRAKVDWLTTITCKDPGLIQANDMSAAFGAGTGMAGNIQQILDSFMPGVNIGAVGHIFEIQPTLLKSNSYSGSVLNVLSQLTGGNFAGGNLFFENQKAFILLDHECLPSDGFDILDENSGLLGSPDYEETFVHASCLFEPNIRMAQILDLESLTQSWLNGTKKVVAYEHTGTISGAVASGVVTNITLYAPLDSKGFQVLGLGVL